MAASVLALLARLFSVLGVLGSANVAVPQIAFSHFRSGGRRASQYPLYVQVRIKPSHSPSAQASVFSIGSP